MSKKFLTNFPLKESYKPKYFILDATNKTLGRLSTLASKLLRGKTNPVYTPGIDLGNFVIIVNAKNIKVSGKKEYQKFYYRQSQKPGSLKKETFFQLQSRIPTRILENSIWGMLPKGVLGRRYYSRLFVYPNEVLDLKKGNKIQTLFSENLFLFPEND